MESKIKKISMDMKFYEAVASGTKTRTARTEIKADIGEVVQIFDRLFVITERKMYNFRRLVDETYIEEGFSTPEELSTALYRIYGTDVYSTQLYSHKFAPYIGEISDQLKANGHSACFGCSKKNLYTVQTSWGGEFWCHRGNRLVGGWNNAHKRIDVPERCSMHGGD